ncbi:MAG TPA: DUF2089 family protein [Sedimentisphaerales bacterium]|nr:DUF2089 family protein [Sedimentisphaerales bacterium]
MAKKIQQLELPANCPLCRERIEITQIKCTGCGSEINGSFSVGGAELPVEYQKFIKVFLRQRGNISAVEAELGISYPTINKMLDRVNELLQSPGEEKPLSRKEVLDAIEKGEMTVKDATYILRTRR